MFSSLRGEGSLPPRGQLEALTVRVVRGLLEEAGLADGQGWITKNITAALLYASLIIDSWEGEEWALTSGEDGAATTWAAADDPRRPYAWLRARAAGVDAVVGVYQDDANFGLSFINDFDRELPVDDVGSLRSRQNIDLIDGRIRAVDVAYDTSVEGSAGPGLVTEVLLHGDSGRTLLLIAAEAYPREEWHLYDESVVALTGGTAAADRLQWVPVRRSWRSANTGASAPTPNTTPRRPPRLPG